MRIGDKKAIVVGGASGMGQASAELLARLGAQVAVIDRESSAGADVAAHLGGTFVAADVTDFAGTEAAISTAAERLGGIHVSVTTAGGARTPDGVFGRRTLARSGPHDLDAFRYVLDLNATATFNICRIAAEWMSRNEPEDEERESSSTRPRLRPSRAR